MELGWVKCWKKKNHYEKLPAISCMFSGSPGSGTCIRYWLQFQHTHTHTKIYCKGIESAILLPKDGWRTGYSCYIDKDNFSKSLYTVDPVHMSILSSPATKNRLQLTLAIFWAMILELELGWSYHHYNPSPPMIWHAPACFIFYFSSL